jgi:hypothetical protein
MNEMGLLLTPEITKWPDVSPKASPSEPWSVAATRCSFTELAPAELLQHTEVFGHFAIEFDIQVLRSLGAIPVFYLPCTSGTNAGAEALAAALVACMGEIEVLFSRFSDLEELARNEPSNDRQFPLGKNETLISLVGVKALLSYLTRDIQPVIKLWAAIKALSGFFYPVEDLKHTDLFGYYQQMEWRILANMAKDGIELTRPLYTREMESLLKLDPEFFGQQLCFRDGNYRRVDRCKLFEQLDGKRIIRYARRIIVPAVAVARATEILNEPLDPPVVSLESIDGK